MIRRVLATLLLLPGAALAQQSLAGSYLFQSPAGPVTLILEQQGSAVTGSMRGADGSMFQLQGGLEAQGATGSISTQGGSGFFAMGWVGGQLSMVVAEIDPMTGQPDLANGWSLDFTPAGGSAMGGGGQPPARGGVPMQPGVPQGSRPGMPQGAQENVQRDPALIGSWVYSDTYSSGDFSATTTLQLLVSPDGSYQYGSGNVSLGGDYMGNSGGGGNVTTGQWRTEGGVVYVMEQGSPQWVPHARYYLEGGCMMFTFGDGSRQLWNRR
jgi:hypothetical protein